MGKLKEKNGYVRSTLHKLPGIRADFVRLDNDWQEWNLGSLLKRLVVDRKESNKSREKTMR